MEEKNSEKKSLMNQEKQKKQEGQNEVKNEIIEKNKLKEITIEQLLTDLRNEKNWTYINVVEELSKLGVILEEKTIKKWEIGLVYPELDLIYKLSELYFVPAEVFIIAKSNSYTKGYNAIHQRLIKWFCYLTGLSFKVAYVLMYTILFLALIFAFMFFLNNCETTLEVLRSRK